MSAGRRAEAAPCDPTNPSFCQLSLPGPVGVLDLLHLLVQQLHPAHYVHGGAPMHRLWHSPGLRRLPRWRGRPAVPAIPRLSHPGPAGGRQRGRPAGGRVWVPRQVRGRHGGHAGGQARWRRCLAAQPAGGGLRRRGRRPVRAAGGGAQGGGVCVPVCSQQARRRPGGYSRLAAGGAVLHAPAAGQGH